MVMPSGTQVYTEGWWMDSYGRSAEKPTKKTQTFPFFGGDQTMQIYGKYEISPFFLCFCWVDNIMTPV